MVRSIAGSNRSNGFRRQLGAPGRITQGEPEQMHDGTQPSGKGTMQQPRKAAKAARRR